MKKDSTPEISPFFKNIKKLLENKAEKHEFFILFDEEDMHGYLLQGVFEEFSEQEQEQLLIIFKTGEIDYENMEVITSLLCKFKNLRKRLDYFRILKNNMNLEQQARIIMSFKYKYFNESDLKEYKDFNAFKLLGNEIRDENAQKYVSTEYLEFLAVLFAFQMAKEMRIYIESVDFFDINETGDDKKPHNFFDLFSYLNKHLFKKKTKVRKTGGSIINGNITIAEDLIWYVDEKLHKVIYLINTVFHELSHRKQDILIESPLYFSQLEYILLVFIKDTILASNIEGYSESGNYFLNSTECDARINAYIKTAEFISHFYPEYSEIYKQYFAHEIEVEQEILKTHFRFTFDTQKEAESIDTIPEIFNFLNTTNDRITLEELFDKYIPPELIKEYLKIFPILLLEYHYDGTKKTDEEIQIFIGRCEKILNNQKSYNVKIEKIIKLKELYENILFHRHEGLNNQNNMLNN